MITGKKSGELKKEFKGGPVQRPQGKKKDDLENVVLNYDNLRPEVRGAIRPSGDVEKKVATLVSDGQQFLVRIPKEISRAMRMKKGDKIHFQMIIDPSRNLEELKMEYVRS